MFVGIKCVFGLWVRNCMGLYFYNYIQCEDTHENVKERQSLLYEGGLLLSLRKYPYAILDTKRAFTSFMF